MELIRRIPGHIFRLKLLPENASHSKVEFRDTLSAGADLGKRVPLRDREMRPSFPKCTQRESASHSKLKFWDAISRWGAIWESGPLWSLIPGRSFPKRTQRESASRFEAQKWDALSARSLNGKVFPNRLNGKVHPILKLDSGMYFPLGALRESQFPKQAQRESVSHSGVEFRDAVSEASPKGNCIPF